MLIPIAALVIAMIGGLWWWHLQRITYSTGDAQVTADISDISPEVEGRPIRLYVSEGDALTAGQKLAQLDDSQLETTVSQAEGALDQAQHITPICPMISNQPRPRSTRLNRS